MREKSSEAVGPGVYPPVIFGFAILSIILQRIFGVPSPLSKSARLAGFPLLILGFLLGGTAVKAQYRAGTPVDPHLPSTALVQSGPYRLTRNPIYLAFVLIASGFALLLNSLWSLSLMPIMTIILDKGMVKREENYLEQKFGEEYRQYKKRVPRWL
jgi:protein-S-isoprenylcysteine O-methyltransferase Ste14